MSKRLQVLLDEPEWRDVQRAAWTTVSDCLKLFTATECRNLSELFPSLRYAATTQL
jgi:hypothetical protein